MSTRRYPNFHGGRCDKCGAHVKPKQGFWMGTYSKERIFPGGNQIYTYTYDIIRCSECMGKEDSR